MGGGSLPYYCPLEKKVNQDLLESSKSYDEETTVAPKISESKENIEENEKYDVEQYQVINKCIRSTAKCEDDNDNKDQKEKIVHGGSKLLNHWKKRDTNNTEEKNENEKSIFKLWEGRTNGWAKPQSKVMSMKQLLEYDVNDNIGVKVDVISSSIDSHTKDDNDNICDTEIDKVTPNIPNNEYIGDNIDTKVIGEENMKQPVEHDINNNIDVKADAVSS